MEFCLDSILQCEVQICVASSYYVAQARKRRGGACHLTRLKPHALARMKERGITRHQVERVLTSPIETVQVRFGRRAAFGNINGRLLLLVYEISNGEKEVITTFWTTAEGLRRYGFLRI